MQITLNQIWQDVHTGFQTFDIRTWAKQLVQVTPPLQWNFSWLYLLLIAIFLVGAIVMLFLRRMHPPLRERWSWFFWSNIFIGAILYFMRDQRIPYLGTNLLRVAHEFFILFWLNSIIWYHRTGMKQEKLAEAAIARKEKYLPKAKK